uniref:BAH domain-containing protein n=2 Tax=Latimeria chalumnae TaxID=7897 RepID=H3AUS9_LATCH
EVVRVRDTVLLRSGSRECLPYVAKISAIWEKPCTGKLFMSLFWYYRPENTQASHDSSSFGERELFASRHQDVNSVACIEEKCFVLTFAEYCRFHAMVKRREEGTPDPATIVPRMQGGRVPLYRRVPDSADPSLIFYCRYFYNLQQQQIV